MSVELPEDAQKMVERTLAETAPNGNGAKVSNGGSSDFVARQTALALSSETPFARGGGQLYVWRDGCYRPGEQDARRRLTDLLGDEWKRNRAEDVLGFLRDSSPQLWEQPPRDRINFRNGLLDLDTGKLAPHDPDFLSPVSIDVDFDPSAKSPRIDTFLAEVLAVELAEVVFELVGYLLTADQSLQVAVMLLGGGANGKSTLLALIGRLLGEHNVSNVALHRLEEDRFAPAELYGKLANTFADLDARALAASSMFKSIVGGDSITGERKYAAPFTFKPYARLLFSANEPPPTPDGSDAFFRRWLILPFERRFDGKNADRDLLAKLTTPLELSGLVNVAIETLPDLRARGAFTTTEAAQAASERFRVDADSVAGFLAERCTLRPEGRVSRPALFEAYREWCSENNRRPLSKQRFNKRVESLHPGRVYVVVVRGTRLWSGIELGAAD